MLSHASSSHTIPRCKVGTRPWPGNSELTLRIVICKGEQTAGDDWSILALKPMGRVNQSLKQRVPVAPQNGDFVTTKIKKKFNWFSNFIAVNIQILIDFEGPMVDDNFFPMAPPFSKYNEKGYMNPWELWGWFISKFHWNYCNAKTKFW